MPLELPPTKFNNVTLPASDRVENQHLDIRTRPPQQAVAP